MPLDNIRFASSRRSLASLRDTTAAVEILAGSQVGLQTADMGIGKRHGHSLAVVGRRDTHMDKNIFDSARLFM